MEKRRADDDNEEEMGTKVVTTNSSGSSSSSSRKNTWCSSQLGTVVGAILFGVTLHMLELTYQNQQAITTYVSQNSVDAVNAAMQAFNTLPIDFAAPASQSATNHNSTIALPGAEASTPSSPSLFSLANEESFGFFTDIPSESWQLKKSLFQDAQRTQHPLNSKVLDRLTRYPLNFFTDCYEPEFTCPHERRLGSGDGGKWICDPHRITATAANAAEGEKCLIYSVGVKGDVQFEAGVTKHISDKCEIHSFDLNDRTPRGKPVSEVVQIAGGVFHHWGIRDVEKTAWTKQPWKTLKATLLELGHHNRTMDIFKVDCEGCEWDFIHTWLKDLQDAGIRARQILFEVHAPPSGAKARAFFDALLDAGYVIFHKEANALAGASCYEYAWILLDPKFQK